jgi:hypothetical protein
MPPAKRLPCTLAPALPCHCRSPPRLPQAPARPPPAPSPPLAGQTRPAQPLFPCCIAPGRPNPTKKTAHRRSATTLQHFCDTLLPESVAKGSKVGLGKRSRR